MIKITNPNQIKFEISHKVVSFSKETKIEIDNHWEAKSKGDPYLYSGHQFSCQSVQELGKQVTIKVNKTEYKNYIWMSDNKLLIPGVRPIGVGCIFYNKKDDTFTFLQRSNNVGRFKNMIGVVGGTLDYSKNIRTSEQMKKFITSHLLTEINEEVITKNPINVRKASLIGIYMNDYLVYRYVYNDEIVKTKNFESVGTITVKTNELLDFAKQNEDIMLETMQSRYQDLIEYAKNAQAKKS